jgi:hypothetical protein
MKTALLLVPFLLLAGCSERPSRAKFPGPQGRTTDLQQAAATKAVMGGFDPLKGGAQQTTAKAGDPSKAVSGEVLLGKSIKVPAGAYLYLAVRSTEGGPPLAARREASPRFPYTFSLSEADAMMQGRPFEGDVELTARLDQDGDPLTRQPGDFFGSVKTRVGARALRITIDQPIK